MLLPCKHLCVCEGCYSKIPSKSVYKQNGIDLVTIQECPVCRTAITGRFSKKKPDFEIDDVVSVEREKGVVKTGIITGYDMNDETYSIRFHNQKEEVSGQDCAKIKEKKHKQEYQVHQLVSARYSNIDGIKLPSLNTIWERTLITLSTKKIKYKLNLSRQGI